MSLLVWYPLHKDLNDYSGNNNHLANSSPNNIVLDPTTGRIGQSYNFDGVGYLYSKDNIEYKNVTYCAWIYNTGGNSLYRGIVNNFMHNTSTGYNTSFFINGSGCLGLCISNRNTSGNNHPPYHSTSTITPNVWNHVIVSVNITSGDINFYINGNFINTIKINPIYLPLVLKPEKVMIGQWSWGYREAYNYIGKMNDVRVYDHILSTKEIKDIYKTEVLHYSLSRDYQFDNKLYDTSGYGLVGSITSPVTPKLVWENDDSTVGSGSYKFEYDQCIESDFPIMDEYSISVWFNKKIKGGKSDGGNIVAISTGTDFFPLQLFINDTNSLVIRSYTAYTAPVYIVSDIAINTWHNIVMSLQRNGECKVYHNGNMVKTFVSGNIAIRPTDKFYIGNLRKNHTLGFQGNISDVRMFARLLSEVEVKQIYQDRLVIDKDNNIYCRDINEFDNIDHDNLVYNGDIFLKDNTNFPGMMYTSEEGGCLQRYGSVHTTSKDFIPINTDDTYEFSFEARSINPDKLSISYTGLMYRDNTLDRDLIYRDLSNTGRTTLAVAVKNGDTTITVASTSGWYDGTNEVNYWIGVYDNAAWGYNKTKKFISFSEITNNVITLQKPWDLGSYPIGTKIANAFHGSHYNYFHNTVVPATWTTYKFTINSMHSTGVAFRYSTAYARVMLYLNFGQDSTYGIRVRNIKLKNLSRPQNVIIQSNSISFNKKGIIPYELNEIGMNIRYIRDHIGAAGNTVNADKHWVQITALNSIDANMSIGIENVTASNGTKYPQLTDGNLDTSSYIGTTGADYITLDLGRVQQIDKIIIHHYYGDPRTYYGTKTEVSQDGINWITVFDSAISGEYVETDKGNEIILYPESTYVSKNTKDIHAKSFNEM